MKGRPNMDNFTTKTELYQELTMVRRQRDEAKHSCYEAEERIAQLTKERDIARGMYCSLAEWHDKTGKGGAEASAAVLGWDVYAKEGKA